MNLPEFGKQPGAIAIDLDGTLLNSDTELSDRNREAVVRCLDGNIPVIIATSRPARWMPHMLGEDLAARCSFILSNGAVVRAAAPFSGNEKNVIPRNILDETMALMLSLEPDLGLTLEIEGYEFGTNRHRTPEELWDINRATPDMVLTLEEALKRGPTKIAAVSVERDQVHILGALKERFGHILSPILNGDLSFLNITMAHATKPKAIERLIAPAGLTLDDVLAFGDDIPDLDMLQACGTAVAMANACEEVLGCTPYHTVSNDEDGVAAVLEKLIELLA